MPLFGRASWPGVEGYEVQANYTYRHGAAPALATMMLPLGVSPRAFGDLVFTDGERTVPIRGAKLHEYKIDFKRGIITLGILDRRWRWAFSVIDGAYNVRDDGSSIPEGGVGIGGGGQVQGIIPSTLRTVRQLATLCLLEMGEIDFSLEGLPLIDYPGVHWDLAVAAEALESLCAQYDCVICLPPMTNKVKIVRRGTGNPPPANLPYAEAAPSVEVSENPAVVVVVGSEIEFDIRLRLKAVGDDTTGRILPINDLTYAPKQIAAQLPGIIDNLWAADPPPIFGNIPRLALLPGQKNREAQNAWIHNLAAGSVYRKYQVDLKKNVSNEDSLVIVDERPPEIPDFYGKGKPLKLTRLDQFSITNHQVQTSLQATGFYAFMPADVSGVFCRDHQWMEADHDSLGNSRNSEITETSFSVDARHNVVTFSNYLYQRVGFGLIRPASLVLRCAITLRDLATYAPFRYVYGVATGTPMPTGAVIVRRPELIARFRVNYDLQNPGTSNPPIYKPIEITSNRVELDKIAAVFGGAATSYFTNRGGGEWKFPGIIGLEPNASLQEITWEVDKDSPCSTRASQNRSHADWLPTLEDVRLRFTVKPIVLGDPPRKLPPIERSMRGTRVIPGLQPPSDK